MVTLYKNKSALEPSQKGLKYGLPSVCGVQMVAIGGSTQLSADEHNQVLRIGVLGVVGGLRGIQTVNAVPSASDLTEIEPP
jgi:hypothetical protein